MLGIGARCSALNPSSEEGRAKLHLRGNLPKRYLRGCVAFCAMMFRRAAGELHCCAATWSSLPNPPRTRALPAYIGACSIGTGRYSITKAEVRSPRPQELDHGQPLTNANFALVSLRHGLVPPLSLSFAAFAARNADCGRMRPRPVCVLVQRVDVHLGRSGCRTFKVSWWAWMRYLG